jgi:anti-anti-sigma factor
LLRVQSQFRVEVRREGRATVIAVSGELDLATSGALEQELERVESADAALLILDLGKLEFIDSTRLSLVVRAHQRATTGALRW